MTRSAMTRPLWRNRYDDAVKLIHKLGFDLVDTRQEWEDFCNDTGFKPRRRCHQCGLVNHHTPLKNMISRRGKGAGCLNCQPNMKRYKDMYRVVKEQVEALDCELMHTESMYRQIVVNSESRISVRHSVCGEEVTIAVGTVRRGCQPACSCVRGFDKAAFEHWCQRYASVGFRLEMDKETWEQTVTPLSLLTLSCKTC